MMLLAIPVSTDHLAAFPGWPEASEPAVLSEGDALHESLSDLLDAEAQKPLDDSCTFHGLSTACPHACKQLVAKLLDTIDRRGHPNRRGLADFIVVNLLVDLERALFLGKLVDACIRTRAHARTNTRTRTHARARARAKARD
jgi:hypothetical protein